MWNLLRFLGISRDLEGFIWIYMVSVWYLYGFIEIVME